MINHPAGPPAQPGLDLDDGPGDRSDGGTATGPPRSGRALTPLSTRRRSRLRARPRAARLAVLLAAFVCAACGLVYELELVALGGYLLGDSVTQTSVVLSVMVFAMGVGSLLAKRLTRRPATSFALLECTLALVGGLSVLALHCCWAWIGCYQAALVVLTCAIGVLIGAEIPLLMTLIQRIRREDAGRAAADLFAADYVGALIGGLAFPFVLLPVFGQGAGALFTGAVNAVAGAAVVLWLFRDEPAPRARLLLWAGCGLVLVTLATAAACSGAIERAARHALYGAQVRFATQSRYQEIVLTGSAPAAPDRRPAGGATEARPGQGPDHGQDGPMQLFLGGRLAVCGPDEYRGNEALVHPAMAGGPDTRVLLLGGGDGLALREVLRHSGVRTVRLVELDPALTSLARTDPALAALSGHALDDPRVRLTQADPLEWLHGGGARADGPYDVVLADLPPPAQAHTDKFRTGEFFGLARRLLAPDGRLAVRTGGGEDTLWPVEAGVRAAGLRTLPYGVPGGPTTSCTGPRDPAGAQSFLLAAAEPPVLALADDAPPPRALTTAALRGSADRLAERRPARPPAPLTLLGPR
ncbi:spermidine synthase [Kitasatospora sp. NPDC050543]|uniref:spermine/spermidine synthase domain-containing protein n=1 Tax=Kitasatospora sp. NPDC050543 TaxID=3364054 RepID=UPI00379CB274